jgi:hypothetical protein
MNYLDNNGWGMSSRIGTHVVFFQGFEFLQFADDVQRAKFPLAVGFCYHPHPDCLSVSFQIFSPYLYPVVEFCQWARNESGLTYPAPNTGDLLRLLGAEGLLGNFSWVSELDAYARAPYVLFMELVDLWENRNPPRASP